jgi:hypothetical protein
LIAYTLPSGPGLIQAMSSPTVVTFQPSRRNDRRRFEHREVRLAAGARERRCDVRLLTGRVLDAHDQHVLGEPALVAAHRGRDPQRQALLAEQGVAAVARSVRPDLAALGEVHDVLDVGLHGHGTSGVAGSSSGAPTVCTHGTNWPSSPSASSTALPMRVMIRMFTTTYAESVISTPICAIGEPIGPMLNGITYIVRPRMRAVEEPVQRAAHLVRVGPVVRGAGVVLGAAADERAVLDAGDVARVGAGEERVRGGAPGSA